MRRYGLVDIPDEPSDIGAIPVSSDSIISGGIVTWSGTGLVFNVSACSYYIDGLNYNSADATLTLATADPTNDRIDVFAVDINGDAIVITGTPSANPQEPQTDPATQIKLTTVIVGAGATVPSGVTNNMIYDENVEAWSKSSNSLTVDYVNTTTPYVGTYCILATTTAAATFKALTFYKASTYANKGDYDIFSFAIKLSQTLLNTESIKIIFSNTSLFPNIKVAEYAITSNNSLGLSFSNTSGYQLIGIPMSNINFTNNGFNYVQIQFVTSRTGISFRLDRILLQYGINQPTSPTGTISFGNVISQSGTASATLATDTLTINGSGLATTSVSGKTLTIAVPTPIPSQTGNNGKYLTTDGTNLSWATIATGGMAIGGSITGATEGSVLFAGVSGVLAQDNANFFWDDTNNRLGIGTATPLNDLHLYQTTNVATAIRVENPNAGTSNSLSLNLFSDTTAGYLQFQKRSSTHTATGIVVANSGLLYNSKGNLIIATADATSWIRFATNGITTADLNLTNNGRLLLGHSTEDVYILDVQGQNSRFGGTTNYTILYSQANGGGIGLFKSDILLSNLIQNELYIDAGIATGDPIRMYVTDALTPGTVRPLCINGNGRETVFGSDTTTNTASSLVTLVSTTKGFLPPRMTSAQRTAITSPATGLIVYQTDATAGLYLRNSGSWSLLGGGSGTVTDVSVVTANGFAGTVATSTTTPAITLTTTITGILKGNGTAISAAVAGTDYVTSNIYTSNGTITSATRTVDLNSNKLVFDNGFSYSRRGVISGYQFIASINAATLQNITTQQAYFINTGGSSLNCIANTTYFFETLIYITGMSSTSGNLTFSLLGTLGSATITSTLYNSFGLDATAPTTAAAISGAIHTSTTSNIPVVAGTGTAIFVRISGIFRVTTAGQIYPSIALANGSIIAQVQPNTHFRMFPVGTNTTTYLDTP